jgi:hypothetical protein
MNCDNLMVFTALSIRRFCSAAFFHWAKEVMGTDLTVDGICRNGVNHQQFLAFSGRSPIRI